MTQKCKYCGTDVQGVELGGGSAMFASHGGSRLPAFPLQYRFECVGPGKHGKHDAGRAWFATELDPVGVAVKRP
jgi:hypothetical protein